MENGIMQSAIHAFLLAIGLLLVIGGIFTGTQGAVVVGIIVTGINIQQFIWWHKQKQSR